MMDAKSIARVTSLLFTNEGRRRGLTYDDVAIGMPGTWIEVVRDREVRNIWGGWTRDLKRRSRPVTVVGIERRPRSGEILAIVVRSEDGGPDRLRFTIRKRGSFVLEGYRLSHRGNWLNLGSFPAPQDSAEEAST